MSQFAGCLILLRIFAPCCLEDKTVQGNVKTSNSETPKICQFINIKIKSFSSPLQCLNYACIIHSHLISRPTTFCTHLLCLHCLTENTAISFTSVTDQNGCAVSCTSDKSLGLAFGLRLLIKLNTQHFQTRIIYSSYLLIQPATRTSAYSHIVYCKYTNKVPPSNNNDN